jgi:hypothetical protein
VRSFKKGIGVARRRWATVVAVTAAGLHAAAPVDASEPVSIELRAAAEVNQPRVLLSDIAVIHGGDAELAGRLAALPVGSVASGGEPTTVERQTLARWTQARLGAGSREFAWKGAERCRVRFAPSTAAAQGAPVGAGSAARGLLVFKGQPATLHSSAGAIRLESRVEVLQDGAQGDEIRVKLPNAAETVLARVSGPGQVEVSQ